MPAKRTPVPDQTARLTTFKKVTTLGIAACVLFSPFNFALAASAQDAGAARPPGAQAKGRAQAAGNHKKRAARALLNPPMKATLDESHKFSAPRSPEPIADIPTAPARPHSESKTRARELLKEGTRQHNAGNLHEAQRLFGQAIVADPRNADGFFNLGALAETRGDYLSALTNYRAGLNIRPNDADLKEAVAAMEAKLSAIEVQPPAARRDSATTQYVNANGFTVPARVFSEPADANAFVSSHNPPLLDIEPVPDDPLASRYIYEPPVETSPGNGTFQLHSTQNATTGSGAPLLSVGNRPPTVPVTSSRGRAAARIAGITLGTALGIGLSAALRGGIGGGGCPRCRIFGF